MIATAAVASVSTTVTLLPSFSLRETIPVIIGTFGGLLKTFPLIILDQSFTQSLLAIVIIIRMDC